MLTVSLVVVEPLEGLFADSPVRQDLYPSSGVRHDLLRCSLVRHDLNPRSWVFQICTPIQLLIPPSRVGRDVRSPGTSRFVRLGFCTS